MPLSRKYRTCGTSFGLILSLLLPNPGTGLASFSAKDFPAAVSAKSAYHTIDAIKPSKESGILTFHVRAAHGTYDIEGFLPLVKLLHEIEVIERIKQDDQGGGFFDGASASVEATGTGLKNLVTDPVGSAKGLGKATGKLGRSIGGMFRKKEEGEKSSFGEKMLGSEERRVAKELGVDVYTTNPYLRDLLNRIARSRMGGKGAVAVLKFLVPIALVASLAITAGSLNEAADQMVNDHSRIELYRLNKEALLGLGFGESDISRFLNSPDFSPREQTYLRFYLEKLKYVPEYREIFTTISKARSPWEARKILYAAQMLAHGDKGQFVKLWSFAGGLAVQHKTGKIVAVAALDDLDAAAGKEILQRSRELSRQTGLPAEIWNGGKIDASFLGQAGSQGIKTRGWFYLLGDKVREEL